MRQSISNLSRNAALALFSLIVAFAADAWAVTIVTVPVANPGNPADTVVMGDGTSGYGSAAYS